MAAWHRLPGKYEALFNPVAYADRYGLIEYKGSDVHVKVQQGMLKQQFNLFKQNDIKGHRLLELGTGPTIHYSVIPSQYFDEVYLSDYTQGCQNVIKNWISKTPGSLDFANVFDFISGLYKQRIKPSELEQSLRMKIKDVLKCDVLQKNPLEPSRMVDFDCIICCGVLESASSSVESFESSFSNIAELLHLGGHFVSSFFLGSPSYNIGEHQLDACSVSFENIKKGLEIAGFKVASWEEIRFDTETTERHIQVKEVLTGFGTVHGIKRQNSMST